MANGQRSKNIHATSRKRHKSKQLHEDIIKWRKNPMMYLKELQATHKEWHPMGIGEITEDKPGQHMFSLVIIIPKDPPQLVVQKKSC
jgi:hypothetical protein